MNVFELRNRLVANYGDFVRGFFLPRHGLFLHQSMRMTEGRRECVPG